MTNIQIEKAQTSDLANIISLIGQADMSPDNHLTPQEVRDLFEDFRSNPRHELYVAKQQTNVLGTFSLLVLQHLSHNGGRSLIVEDVVVKTEFQGKGIGRKMMEFAIMRGRELGCYKIILSSGESRTDAHAFYEGLGFRKHGFTFYLPLENSTSTESHKVKAEAAKDQQRRGASRLERVPGVASLTQKAKDAGH